MTTTDEVRHDRLTSIAGILERTDDALRQGILPGSVVVPTGFGVLDESLDGGVRSGELVMLGGPQGIGKSTMAIQMVRNVVRAGGSAVVFSYESEAHTILERLIALEASAVGGTGSAKLRHIRRAFEVRSGEATTVDEQLATLPGALDGMRILRGYADRLHLHESTTAATDLVEIERVVREVTASTGIRPLVLIDHLQKVPLVRHSTLADDDRTVVVERLKDLALSLQVPLLAVVAADRARGRSSGRLRVTDLRGASSLAHEADVVLLLNEKYDVVARHHLVYDLANAERFKGWVVMTVEKNRHGIDKVELEFRKYFTEGRFDPLGQRVVEQLIEDRAYVD